MAEGKIYSAVNRNDGTRVDTIAMTAIRSCTGGPPRDADIINDVSSSAVSESDTTIGQDAMESAEASAEVSLPSPSESLASTDDSEHTYSSISNTSYEIPYDDTILPVTRNVAVEGQAEDTYQKLHIFPEPRIMSRNAILGTVIGVLGALLVGVLMVWALREHGVFFGGATMETTGTTALISSTEMNPTTSTQNQDTADIGRKYVGENATLLWEIRSPLVKVPIICRDNNNKKMFEIDDFTYVYKPEGDMRAGVETLVFRHTNTVGFTLTNVTKQDAGTYICGQPGRSNETRTLFIWGRPRQPSIALNGSTLTCDVTSTSQPEPNRPNMSYIWHINGSSLNTYTNFLPISGNTSKRAPYVSCRGQEQGSDLISEMSDRLLLSP